MLAFPSLFYLEKRFNNRKGCPGIKDDSCMEDSPGCLQSSLVTVEHKYLLRAPLGSEDLGWRRLASGVPPPRAHGQAILQMRVHTHAHMHTCILQCKDFFKNTQMLPKGRVSVGRGAFSRKPVGRYLDICAGEMEARCSHGPPRPGNYSLDGGGDRSVWCVWPREAAIFYVLLTV